MALARAHDTHRAFQGVAKRTTESRADEGREPQRFQSGENGFKLRNAKGNHAASSGMW